MEDVSERTSIPSLQGLLPRWSFGPVFHLHSSRCARSLADIDAMLLGWGSSAYAWPGGVRAGSRTAAGAQVSDWWREGVVFAWHNLNEAPGLFFRASSGCFAKAVAYVCGQENISRAETTSLRPL